MSELLLYPVCLSFSTLVLLSTKFSFTILAWLIPLLYLLLAWRLVLYRMWPSRTGVDFWNNFPFFQFLLKKYILLFKIFSRCSVSVFLLLLHREIILPLQIFFSLCSFSFSVLLPLREKEYVYLLRLFSSFCRRTRWSKTPSAFGLVFKAFECTLSLFIEGLHITNWKNDSLTLPAKCFKVSSVTLVGANCPPPGQ